MVKLPSDVDLAALAAEQEAIAAQVERRDRFGGLRGLHRVGGVDVAYHEDRAIAAAVVVDRRTLEVVSSATASVEERFPYIPGYLAYRELPAVREALARLDAVPPVVLVDGHGLLHPRSCGLACMLGVLDDVATIGVGKRLFVGEVEGAPTSDRPAPVRHAGRVAGYALLTGRSTRPIYASTGHRVSARTAARLVRELARFRLPEPTRQADKLAARARRGGRGS